MNHRHRIHLFIAVALLMIFPLKVWSASQSAAKEEIQTVAVLPFEVHARDDARSLQQQIAAQLSVGLAESPYIRILPEDTVRGLIQGKPVDPRLALRIGQETGAAFVVTGSLTRLGDMLSADVGITDVTSKERSVIFAQGNDLDPLIARLKNDILLKILTGQMIADVRLEGNKRIEDNVILNVLKSTKGKLFSKENLSADIKAIYALGYFKDIRARVADTPGGKILSFHLEERPLIISVAVEEPTTSTKRISRGCSRSRVLGPQHEQAAVGCGEYKDLLQKRGISESGGRLPAGRAGKGRAGRP